MLTAVAIYSYGDEVENYLDVYLRTPGLEKQDVARALLARGNARKMAGERLLAKAQQDFQAVAKLDPSNRELQGYLRRSDMVSAHFCVKPPDGRRGRRALSDREGVGGAVGASSCACKEAPSGTVWHSQLLPYAFAPTCRHSTTDSADRNVWLQIHFVDEPASQRAPPEIWERIARFIPRYHLRSWLFVSAFHRDIAVRLIFHTIDLYFGEDQDLNRGLDIFDRVKVDQSFARRVKALRLHWAYEENDMFDLMTSAWLYAPSICDIT